ncbi:alanine/glycine:cation symporter family protein [Domibacillus enclensis]|uniref:Alanine or glycine:cation symporter, AGCS family n=1 Tax=Domibacillus enclensis TaxID=1017273 RepID=A0A1N6NBY8_9BACI|nr:alanine/glycine:cation symporter family protein [Domibacillus enclensis]OXS79999.1 sodium:alanine symporter family protein [Domibacillus enclensis]SIP89588.1 alanine or glycine:cation symporter, AGCS family [Domibacillus enclensis]
MAALDGFISMLNNWMYSYIMIAMLIVLGLFFTFRTGFVQFKMIPEMFRVIFEKSTISADGKKGISSFQAFTISAASRIGTGNLAGVATAIALGGPGAVFWMWIIALIGAGSSFVESTLAQVYKVKDGDVFRGGPAYYMEKGLNKRWMGIVFAVAITLSFGLVFNAVQSNTIAIAMNEGFGVSRYVTAVVLAILTGFIVFGGLKRIVHVTQILVPVMAVVYVLLAVVVLAMNITEIPAMFMLIVNSAFGLQEAAGGALGAALMNGIKRGLFSNEAGMGSAPNAAATAAVSHPVKQGLIQTLGVFIDTIVICSATAFIILLSGEYLRADAQSINLTQSALSVHIGDWAVIFLAVAIFMFAFSSVVGNYYYGETNIEFIKESKPALLVYRLAVMGMVFFGSIAKISLVWNMADLFMAIMAFINLIAIAMLSKIAVKVLADYSQQRKEGKEPVFYSDSIDGIGEVECWERNREE